MKNEKITIKDKSIVIKVPYAKKYLFVFKQNTPMDFMRAFKEFFDLHKRKKRYFTNAPLEHIICFQGKRKS